MVTNMALNNTINVNNITVKEKTNKQKKQMFK